MDGMESSNKVIHSPFLGVNVRISLGEKLGSAENNEIDKTETPHRKRGNCIDYRLLTHSIRLTNEAIIDPKWGCWLAQNWPLSGSSPPLAMLKMSGSLCSLLDTVYWRPICRRLITCLPPGRICEHLHRTVVKFDFHKAWRGAKLTCAIFAASTTWEWRNTKENWPLRNCKWAVLCL